MAISMLPRILVRNCLLHALALPHVIFKLSVQVIQLKRFRFRNHIFSDKINRKVDYPTEGLDMSPFLAQLPETVASVSTVKDEADHIAAAQRNADGAIEEQFKVLKDYRASLESWKHGKFSVVWSCNCGFYMLINKFVCNSCRQTTKILDQCQVSRETAEKAWMYVKRFHVVAWLSISAWWRVVLCNMYVCVTAKEQFIAFLDARVKEKAEVCCVWDKKPANVTFSWSVSSH